MVDMVIVIFYVPMTVGLWMCVEVPMKDRSITPSGARVIGSDQAPAMALGTELSSSSGTLCIAHRWAIYPPTSLK